MSFDGMANPFSSQYRGSTTEPNTPEPESVPTGLIAWLIPINKAAQSALAATMAIENDQAEYHHQFIRDAVFNNRHSYCFELSLSQLPQFAHIGWRIGSGRNSLENRGVDLLLEAADDVAGIHARFNWVKGAGGFFVIADNKRGKEVMMNGEFFLNDYRAIPYRNTIMIGECLFKLDYVKRTPEEEEQFQVELASFHRRFHHKESPLVLPTPGENDARFGEWLVQYAISRGTYGVVYMVTHARDGKPAAAKQILKSNKNRIGVDREINMVERIKELRHKRIASPFDIRHRKTLTKVEVARIRALLDESWEPTFNNITDEYIILSPLLTATFRSLFRSSVSQGDRGDFFSQLLDAVAFLHSKGICHRDIKPDNILVRRYNPPNAMLSDFGSASDEEEILYDWPGTIPYLAPEQIERQTHGRAVDYWACALVGVELIGGPETTRRVMPGQHLVEYQRWLDKSESPIADCCRAMLEAEPRSRMTAAEALAQLKDSPVRNCGDSDQLGSVDTQLTIGNKRKH